MIGQLISCGIGSPSGIGLFILGGLSPAGPVIPLQPNIRFTMEHVLAPESEGTITRRMSNRPLADANAWAEDRVINFGSITRTASSNDGDLDVATVTLALKDDDRFIRTLLGQDSTKYMTRREGVIEILSDQGRRDGLEWRELLRGRITNIQTPPGLRASLTLTDIVGSHFTGLDLQQTLGVPIPRTMFPNMPVESENRIFPIVLGEHSDLGKKDDYGDDADKGVLPLVDVGWILLGENGDAAPNDAIVAKLLAPSDLDYEILGRQDGLTRIIYGVSALTPYGESTVSTVTVMTVPWERNETDYVQLTWSPDSNATQYRIYIDNKLADTIEATDGATWKDNGTKQGNGVSPQKVSTAIYDQTISGVAYRVWRMLIMKIGACREITSVYGSDLAENGTPKRVRIGEERFGWDGEILVSNRSGWPHLNPYLELSNGAGKTIRFTPMYVRGPLANHHIKNMVTLAWNGCGDDDIGNGTGSTITEAFFQIQHLVNVYRLMNNGEGYYRGEFPALETFVNGVAKLRSEKFQECQTLTQRWIGGRGYQGSIAIFEPTSLREILRRSAITFACFFATNSHGQFYPFLIDDTITTGRAFRDRIEIYECVSQTFDHEGVETRVLFNYDYDWDARVFRYMDITLEDEVVSAAQGGVQQRQNRQCFYSRDPNTVYDSNSRYLSRVKFSPRYFGWSTNLVGLEVDLGDTTLLTHYEGVGPNGDVDTPFVLMQHSIEDLTPGHERVILVAMETRRLTSTAFPPLVDKDSENDPTPEDTPPPPDEEGEDTDTTPESPYVNYYLGDKTDSRRPYHRHGIHRGSYELR